MGTTFKLRNGSLLLSTEAPGGIYNSAQLKKIAAITEQDAAIVKVTEDQRIALFVKEDKVQEIADELKGVGLAIRHYQDGLHQPITCLGEHCPDHKQDALGAAMRISEELADVSSEAPLRIGINGCARCCVPCHTLDVSIVGDDSGYTINLGGKTSQLPEMASFMAEGVPEEELAPLLRSTIDLYKKYAQNGESLQEVMERVGSGRFADGLLPYSQDAAQGSEDLFGSALVGQSQEEEEKEEELGDITTLAPKDEPELSTADEEEEIMLADDLLSQDLLGDDLLGDELLSAAKEAGGMGSLHPPDQDEFIDEIELPSQSAELVSQSAAAEEPLFADDLLGGAKDDLGFDEPPSEEAAAEALLGNLNDEELISESMDGEELFDERAASASQPQGAQPRGADEVMLEQAGDDELLAESALDVDTLPDVAAGRSLRALATEPGDARLEEETEQELEEKLAQDIDHSMAIQIDDDNAEERQEAIRRLEEDEDCSLGDGGSDLGASPALARASAGEEWEIAGLSFAASGNLMMTFPGGATLELSQALLGGKSRRSLRLGDKTLVIYSQGGLLKIETDDGLMMSLPGAAA